MWAAEIHLLLLYWFVIASIRVFVLCVARLHRERDFADFSDSNQSLIWEVLCCPAPLRAMISSNWDAAASRAVCNSVALLWFSRVLILLNSRLLHVSFAQSGNWLQNAPSSRNWFSISWSVISCQRLIIFTVQMTFNWEGASSRHLLKPQSKDFVMTTDASQALVPFSSKISLDILVQGHSTDAKRGLRIYSRISSRMLLWLMVGNNLWEEPLMHGFKKVVEQMMVRNLNAAAQAPTKKFWYHLRWRRLTTALWITEWPLTLLAFTSDPSFKMPAASSTSPLNTAWKSSSLMHQPVPTIHLCWEFAPASVQGCCCDWCREIIYEKKPWCISSRMLSYKWWWGIIYEKKPGSEKVFLLAFIKSDYYVNELVLGLR